MPAQIFQLHSKDSTDISSEIRDGLMRPVGQKQLPTMLLYDERGLRLYDDITTMAPEYYLFGAEEEILKNNANDIVRAMHNGDEQVSTDEVVLELGAGALRKTSHLLLGLSRLVPETSSRAPITYYALDLEEREIERTLGEISASNVGKSLQGRVETKGICGTYDEGLKFVEQGGLFDAHHNQLSPSAFSTLSLRDASPISSDASSATSSKLSMSSPPSTPGDVQVPLHILFLGSSLGNFSRKGAACFLRSLPLRPGMGDTLLLGMDHDNDKAVIEEAYNDPKGYTRQFIMNGLRAAGRALGDESMFDENKWEYVNRYNIVSIFHFLGIYSLMQNMFRSNVDLSSLCEIHRHTYTFLGQHEAYFKSKSAQSIKDPLTKQEIVFLPEEMLKIEESFKVCFVPGLLFYH
ncbi:hypothetical protein H0H81_002392 [Sphagnurus paluster]|uniref:Histidine-specific methyltransferase SAM-dependent domain-containing protein n=1 Tax=Sphagnurus paluster TaxID=117069 RepID=A0A9P7GML5_9AGAR|nr:hypothetical protein H0H81_002392 [Sphagnurus paluster]